MDVEIIRVIERIARGMEVNDYSLAYDIIETEAK